LVNTIHGTYSLSWLRPQERSSLLPARIPFCAGRAQGNCGRNLKAIV
jgi:hypothetical protein